MMLTFTKAQTADHVQLTDISIRSKRYWNYPERYYVQWKEELTITEEYIHSHLVYTARTAGMIVGYYSIVQVEEEGWLGKMFMHRGYWLDHICIRPEFIGQGYGTKLMDHAKTICRMRGIEKLYMYSDPHCQGFYEKQGAVFLCKADSSIRGRQVPLYELPIDGPEEGLQ